MLIVSGDVSIDECNGDCDNKCNYHVYMHQRLYNRRYEEFTALQAEKLEVFNESCRLEVLFRELFVEVSALTEKRFTMNKYTEEYNSIVNLINRLIDHSEQLYHKCIEKDAEYNALDSRAEMLGRWLQEHRKPTN